MADEFDGYDETTLKEMVSINAADWLTAQQRVRSPRYIIHLVEANETCCFAVCG